MSLISDFEALRVMHEGNQCLLMFSGGRDSTIAAVRLARKFASLTLVTVTSDHLVGIQTVQQRVVQLKPHLPAQTEWLQVEQPLLPPLKSLGNASCLPCQRAYAIIGGILAKRFGVRDMALGYAKYQSDWPEQTQQATTKLKKVLERFGLRLQLPVYDLVSKAEAEKELTSYGLSADSLEQKCLRQENNLNIPPDLLEQEVEIWGESIIQLLRGAESMPLSIVSRIKIGKG